MNDIAKRILETMRAQDLSYADLSSKTGISKSALQRYATGNTPKIPMDRMESIADALGVSPAYLMGWEDLLSHVREESSAGRTAAKEEMYHTFGTDHYAADLRLMDNKTVVLYYKAMERYSAQSFMSSIGAIEELDRDSMENIAQIIRAYLRADTPIKKIVDTALQPYFIDDLSE